MNTGMTMIAHDLLPVDYIADNLPNAALVSDA